MDYQEIVEALLNYLGLLYRLQKFSSGYVVIAYYCMYLCTLHDRMLPALAPETTDDTSQFRRSWSLGREKTKQKGKVTLMHIVFCSSLNSGQDAVYCFVYRFFSFF